MAGEEQERSFGTGIRYFRHDQMIPSIGRIALHPGTPFMFALNSFSTVHLHHGFTFNTHDKEFKGIWGPDNRVSQHRNRC